MNYEFRVIFLINYALNFLLFQKYTFGFSVIFILVLVS